jgi:hypothetical protein
MNHAMKAIEEPTVAQGSEDFHQIMRIRAVAKSFIV